MTGRRPDWGPYRCPRRAGSSAVVPIADLAVAQHGVRFSAGTADQGGDACSSSRLGHLVGGVVHQDVEAAEFADAVRDEAVAELLVALVAGDRQGASPGALDEYGGVGVAGFLREVAEGDVGALTGECQGDRAADVAAGAGLEPLLPPPARLPRGRRHCGRPGQPHRRQSGPVVPARYMAAQQDKARTERKLTEQQTAFLDALHRHAEAVAG
ncbi:hypothetical protein GCM10010440_56860 [Kitasatospora cinereorecta]